MPDTPTTDEPDRDLSHNPTTLPPTNKLNITDLPLAKLYTNNTGRLPIKACSGNQYITIAFYSRCNPILCTPYVYSLTGKGLHQGPFYYGAGNN
jgi:hypothetical protein